MVIEDKWVLGIDTDKYTCRMAGNGSTYECVVANGMGRPSTVEVSNQDDSEANYM